MKNNENNYYEIIKSFLIESTKILGADRKREFIIVSHTFIGIYMDNLIVDYFVKKRKRKDMIDIVSEFRFPKKLKILKENNIIPKGLAKVLNNYNTIRNRAAHCVEWENEVKKLNIELKSDFTTLGAIPAGLIGTLDACREISQLNKTKRIEHINDLDEDFQKDGIFSHWFK